ncbi:hypothetical protein Q4561_02685 [Alteromonas sp. 1_MG-2023]|uniref:hypothetical protein n=1 Tax=Alteromonas sp. 1_MG-2023 TaxID=3062669 RepID=UPI0026E2833E|nr:hypothetical protein [Alteromonas sp. 1_MG-2023]MDO6565956.1 hypothetical protein [Alteromonas sp. 1_MG-2023]
MDSLEIEKKTELDSVQQNKIKNETLTTELHFDLLKQYAWLSSAAIGAIVVLVQLKAVEASRDLYISLGFFVASIIMSIMGQDHIIDSLLKGKRIYDASKVLKLIRWISMMCFGIGVGYLSANVFVL